MKYSEAKQVLQQQDAAKAVMAKYEKLVSAHKAHGFDSRREMIKALQEIDKAEGGKARGGVKVKGKARGPRGLSPEVIDQIKSLKAEGKTNADIARTTGVSPLTVAKYVKGQARKGKTAKAGKAAPAKRKAGKGKKAGGRGVAPEIIDQIQKLKSEGKSNVEISRITGVGPITVAKYVKGQKSAAKPTSSKPKAPAKRKKKGSGGKPGFPPEKVDQIKTMKSEGKTNAEISRTVGASPITVAKYVKSDSQTASPVSVVKSLVGKASPAKRKARKAKAKTKGKAKAEAKK